MTLELNIDEPFSSGIRRAAREEIDMILIHLAGTGPDRPAAVHEARKSGKKIRAILRLARESLGRKRYRRENLFFRNMGRQLAPVRDSAAWVEAFDKITHRYSLSMDEKTWSRLREELLRHHQEITRSLLENSSMLESLTARIRAARERVAAWPSAGEGFTAISIGIRAVYRQGRDELWKARHEPTVEHLHEFRKQVKYLWYQIRILRNAWPCAMDELSNSLHALSILLGDDHDLVELKRFLATRPEWLNSQDSRFLLDLIESHRAELQAEALLLGRRLYAEKPLSFTRRILMYWKIARDR
ncbi:MAG TPA: CHAD domain-containing protein [bacterium]|nr:CHAD domain-containing protein [bacterium]